MTLFCKLFKRFDHTESECTQQANGRVKAVGSVSVGIIPDDVDTDEFIIQRTEHGKCIKGKTAYRVSKIKFFNFNFQTFCKNIVVMFFSSSFPLLDN